MAPRSLRWFFVAGLALLACSEPAPPATPSNVNGTGGALSASGTSAGGGVGTAGGNESAGSMAGEARGGLTSGGAGAAGAETAFAGAVSTGGVGGVGGAGGVAGQGGHPSSEHRQKSEIIAVLERVNEQFADKWPDPAARLPGSRPSNIWTRAVYFEGLLGLYSVAPRPALLNYALDWAKYHDWSLRTDTTNADNQCAGQAYFDLFELEGAREPHRIEAIEQSLNAMLKNPSNGSWSWVDAVQMSMPLWARLGSWSGNAQYLEKMHSLYVHTKQAEGGGLYDAATGLWWRDAKWKPEQALTPSGKNVYWSRGNGWVLAALARVLERLPAASSHSAEYEQDFVAMAEALRARQRSDGFWNASLDDPAHFGGPETTGTSLFVYGMAWGIRRGLLSEEAYGAVVDRAWQAMVDTAVRADGFLGFVQSTGDDPSDGQPLSADKQPDFEDYGVGCFLLAGSELAKLAAP
jgi:unsaturated rhamnogalacturonyl hydrolase